MRSMFLRHCTFLEVSLHGFLHSSGSLELSRSVVCIRP